MASLADDEVQALLAEYEVDHRVFSIPSIMQ